MGLRSEFVESDVLRRWPPEQPTWPTDFAVQTRTHHPQQAEQGSVSTDALECPVPNPPFQIPSPSQHLDVTGPNESEVETNFITALTDIDVRFRVRVDPIEKWSMQP
jgi:hypothetical protein